MSRARCSAQGFATLPLLIGGATTSRVHTAVKIAPHYTGPGHLRLGREASVPRLPGAGVRRRRRPASSTRSKPEYERVREQHADKKGPELVTLAEARANATRHRLGRR